MEKSEVKTEKQRLTANDFAMYLGCYCRYREHNLILNCVAREEDQPLPLVLDDEVFEIEGIKPILRPISDMSEKEQGELARISKGRQSEGYAVGGIIVAKPNYDQLKFFRSHYFDVFGWIDAGLAIDATSLTPNPYNQ